MMRRAVFCFLLGITVAFQSGAQTGSVASEPPIAAVQGRPALPDLFSGAPIVVTSNAIEIDQVTSLRSGFAERLESWGLLSPHKAITLTIDESVLQNMPEIENVRWVFSRAYYFLDKEVPGQSIRVVAWHPFLATAKIKFRGESGFHTYSSWVDVDNLN